MADHRLAGGSNESDGRRFEGNLFDESLDNLADQILDSNDDDADSWAGDKSQAVDTPRPPPYTKVASQFGDFEGEAEKCNMAEVSYHLRKAKLAWMREFGWRKTKQTIMADFFQRCRAAVIRMGWMSVWFRDVGV